MRRSAFENGDDKRSWRWTTVGLWLSSLLIALHPISLDGTWWELSKGRMLTSGEANPTAALIAGPIGADADWLSGLLPYHLVATFGMSGLMGFKIVAALSLTLLMITRSKRLSEGHHGAAAEALIALGLLAGSRAWEPGVMMDSLGLLAVGVATEEFAFQRTSGRFGLLLAMLCCWANVGPRCVLGLLIALPVLWSPSRNVAKGLGRIAAGLAACSLTAAGSMTLPQSLISTFPPLVERPEILLAADWQPWWRLLPSSDALAFLGMSVAGLWICRERLSWRFLGAMFLAHLLASASAEQLPLAAIGLMLAMTTSPSERAAEARTSPRRGSLPTKEFVRNTSSPAESYAMGIVLLMVGGAAMVPWKGCGSGLGWGLDPRIDPDAFAASIGETPLTGVAHCVGLREAGLLCWHAPQRLRPFDTPATALVMGRLGAHVLLTSDLSKRWQIPHRRPDGEWGGWWNVVKQREIRALVVPSEQLELITALEPTVWKPLSLNAVSLVYGKAGDPDCTRQIVATLSLRQFVQYGAWIYEPASEAGTGTSDWLAWPLDAPTRYRNLRLARAFRAMQMPEAALKVWQASAARTSGEMRDEFAANQLSLGYQERVVCGRSSEFRLRVCLIQGNRTPETIREILNWTSLPSRPPNDPFVQAATLYSAGNLNAAVMTLPADDPEGQFATAQTLIQAGNPAKAQSVLRDLIARFPEHRLSAMARQLEGRLVL